MKDLLGIVASLISVLGFALYYREVYAGRTKPHLFSWTIWTATAVIVFAAQLTEHAGPGAWMLIVEMFGCSALVVWSMFYGDTRYAVLDWVALGLAFCSLFLWWVTKTPTASVILITLVEVFGFVPTYRKSFVYPFEESPSVYVLSIPKSALALLAMQHYSISTSLYPAAVIALNCAFVSMLLIRRQQIHQA